MIHRPKPIDQQWFAADRLVRDHPPCWRHRNKTIVHEIACPAGSAHGGQLEYTRWAAMPLPSSVDTPSARTRLADRPGFFDYLPTLDQQNATEWHVNFADPQLFGYYGSSRSPRTRCKSPSIRVASLKEALDARSLGALTVVGRQPTPVLVMGAERRCRVATDANAAEGRPNGLYGNAFARADAAAIERATTRIDPPTVTNVIAMAAPAGGRGRYEVADIEFVLSTAYTAFRAAVLESARSRGSDCPVAVHTGFWGCGAFGGHRVLMTTLQTLAAEMAGLEAHRLSHGRRFRSSRHRRREAVL